MASFQSNSQGGAGPSGTPAEEFTVRIPKDTGRKFSLMKFGTGSSVDFSKLGDQPVKIERENNLKEYKTANDLDLLPKFGAGSEFGRDQKEESRRKKYGIMLKRYNPDDQPWHLKIGSGKQAKRFKGVREGTIAENTSYYIFTKAADGAFEAYPVEEWNNFSPVIRYKYLNSDEAEEEYNRRDKTLNYFSIMVRKRMKKEEDIVDDDDPDAKKKGKKKKPQKKKKDLILTDMEEWDDMKLSDEDNDDDDDDDAEDREDEGGGAKKAKPKGGFKKKVKNSKKNSDDEAVEESDEGDYDDREVDYMSDSGSSSSLSGPEEDDKEKKYDEKGVDQEAGLRNILDSEAEDEEEEEEGEKEDNEEEPEEKTEKKEEKKKGDNDSSSSSSEDDSDIEKDAALASAIFLQKEKKEKKEKKDKADATVTDSNEKADARTPTPDKAKDKALKRKAEKTPDGKQSSVKKHKSEDGEGITEDAIRRYLMRKPMTTKDLLQKFKSKKLNMSNEKITHVIVQLLKKINPEKTTIHKKLYLSLKKPE